MWTRNHLCLLAFQRVKTKRHCSTLSFPFASLHSRAHLFTRSFFPINARILARTRLHLMSILPLAGSLTSSHRAFSPHTWLGKCTPAFIDDTAIFLRYNWYARIFIIYTASWQILFSLHGIKKKCVFYGRGSYLTLVRDKNVRRLWTMLSRRGCEGRSEGVGWQSFEGPSHCFYIASSRLCLKVCQRTVSIWRGGCDAQQPPSLFSHPSNSDISRVSLIRARLRVCIREEDVFRSLVAETWTQFAIRPGFFRYGSRKVRV